jgi:glucose/arabinose dehydrogenase
VTPTARGRGALLGTLATMVVVTACAGGSANHAARTTATTKAPSAPSTTAPAAVDQCASPPTTVTGPGGLTVFAADVDFPTALAWAPDGRLFVAERAGRIVIVRSGQVTTFTTVPTVTTERNGGYSERGLLGLALSPDFARDHFVYAFYSRDDFATQVVVRFTDCAGAASAPTTLLTFPSGPDCCHKGGRLRFGPDGDLYITLGDEHSVTPGVVNDPAAIPQDPADPRGKILRYRPDGAIPADNPFGPGRPAYVVGVRNSFGIAFGPDGRLFTTVNGPTGELNGPAHGDDMAFLTTAGARFQWPACYGYSHPLPGATQSCLGGAEPDWSSESDTLVPTGATWVDARGPSPYANHYVFCSALAGMRVFHPGEPHATVTTGPDQCRYDVAQGPDGALYLAAQDAVWRLSDRS